MSSVLLGKCGEITPERNEVAGPEQIRRSAVDVSGGDGKVQCGKEQYCMHVYVRTVYVCMSVCTCTYTHVHCVYMCACVYMYCGGE